MSSEFLPLSVYPDYRSSRLSRKNGTKRVTWSYWEVSISTKICLFLWSWVNPFQSPSNPLFSRKPCTTSRTTVISPLECSAAPPLVCTILALTLGCFQRSLKIGLTRLAFRSDRRKPELKMATNMLWQLLLHLEKENKVWLESKLKEVESKKGVTQIIFFRYLLHGN